MISKSLQIGLLSSISIHLFLFGGSYFLQSTPPKSIYTTVQLISPTSEPLIEGKGSKTSIPSTEESGFPENSNPSKPTPGAIVSESPTPSQCSQTGTTLAHPEYGKNPAPTYPEDCRHNGIEGIVVLEVHLSEAGKPLLVRLKKSSGNRELDASALKAVRTWQFYPAKLNGKPVEAEAEVPIQFRLN